MDFFTRQTVFLVANGRMAADFSSPVTFVLFFAAGLSALALGWPAGQSASVLGDSVSLRLSVAPLFYEENPNEKRLMAIVSVSTRTRSTSL